MGSPAPETSPPDAELRGLEPQKEVEPEINGHSPTTTPNAGSKALVNGDGKEKDRSAETNEENEDVNMGGSKDAPASGADTEQRKTNGDGTSAPTEDVDMPDATEIVDNTKSTEAELPPVETKANELPEKGSETADDPLDDPVLGPSPPEVNGLAQVPPSSDPVPGSEVDLQPTSLSQLALESESTAKPSIEVAMEDAPSASAEPSSKIARERDEDAVDEPAPKRARTTEPREEEEEDSAMLDEAPTQEQASALSSLDKWDDPSVNSQEITPHQRREIRKVLGRVKKTKHGGHFRDSVQKLWPNLWDSYLAKIEKPTDLSEIDRTMRDPNGAYKTIGHFKKDLLLMYENTLAFNGAYHDVTYAAQGCIKAIWDDVLTIPQEEPVKPKPVPKQKPPRESRAAAHPDPVARKASAPPGPSPAREVVPAKPHVSQDKAVSSDRRASTATEGDRPKRTVRAPKPKDIDYTTKPTRKKLKPELQFCEEVISELMHPKNKAINSWFLDAVDAEGLNIPQYYSIIKKPMDLGKVSRMLASGEISGLKDFEKNVRLIFSNCYTFNGTPAQGNAVSWVASQLEDYFNSQMKGKDAWLAKHAKASAPPAASHASDEDEEEEAGEEEDSTQATAVLNKQIQDMEARLREESEKLTDLFAADSPSQTLIDVQQSIVKVVQDRLLKLKGALGDFRQKQEKPSKKTSKPSKSKASSGAARKPANAAAHPKKSGGTKKPPAKRTLTAADKDAIANAINDLEYGSLDRAIEIIKRDTGQNENNQGELELDIDQLSNDALLKLWELCKKVLPNFGKDLAPAVVSSPEVSRPAPAKAPKTAAKPKKNKPMSAREQEERIAQLKGLRELYRPGQESEDMSNVIQAPTPTAESSDDSDSEEE